MKLIRLSFRILSFVWPKMAGKLAFRLFQVPRNKSFRNREKAFFEKARHFVVPHPTEDIDAYELGNPDGKLVLLVHGWDSNAGSLSKIAGELAVRGYRVVTFNLPAHGTSKLKRANLILCAGAMRALLDFLNPTVPFSIVTHSFGSAVSSYTLAKAPYIVDRFVMLTSPNRLIDVFEEFGNVIGLGKRAFRHLISITEQLLKGSIRAVNVEDLLHEVKASSVTIIHDRRDKIISFDTALAIASQGNNRKVIPVDAVGHYRMLWNEQVIGLTVAELQGEQKRIPEFAA